MNSLPVEATAQVIYPLLIQAGLHVSTCEAIVDGYRSTVIAELESDEGMNQALGRLLQSAPMVSLRVSLCMPEMRRTDRSDTDTVALLSSSRTGSKSLEAQRRSPSTSCVSFPPLVLRSLTFVPAEPQFPLGLRSFRLHPKNASPYVLSPPLFLHS